MTVAPLLLLLLLSLLSSLCTFFHSILIDRSSSIALYELVQLLIFAEENKRARGQLLTRYVCSWTLQSVGCGGVFFANIFHLRFCHSAHCSSLLSLKDYSAMCRRQCIGYGVGQSRAQRQTDIAKYLINYTHTAAVTGENKYSKAAVHA